MTGEPPESSPPAPGIDLFGFLIEVWKAKWLFAGIVAFVFALGLSPLILSDQQVASSSLGVARYGFQVAENADPLRRKAARIFDDYLSHVDRDGALHLTDSRLATFDGPRSPNMRSYSFMLNNSTGRGILSVTAESEGDGFFRQVHKELAHAAEAQVAATREHVASYLKTLNELNLDGDPQALEVAADLPFELIRFLSDPAVASGDFALVRFAEFDPGTISDGRQTAGSSSRKQLTISILAALVCGAFVVLVRLAARRKRRRA